MTETFQVTSFLKPPSECSHQNLKTLFWGQNNCTDLENSIELYEKNGFYFNEFYFNLKLVSVCWATVGLSEASGPLSLWFTILGLPCEDGKQYFFTHPACQATCHDPKAAEQCPFPDTEGCYCPDGLYLRDDQCVPLEDCGCRLDNGTYVDVS